MALYRGHLSHHVGTCFDYGWPESGWDTNWVGISATNAVVCRPAGVCVCDFRAMALWMGRVRYGSLGYWAKLD